MKKWKYLLILVLAMSLFVCGIGVTKALAAEPIIIRVGWLTAANGTTHAETCNAFKKLVEERSNGEIVVELYPAAQLGQGRDMYEGMIMGTVDGCFEGTAVLSFFTKQFYFFDVPLLFRSYDEVFALCDNEEFMAPRVAEIEKLGIRILGLTEIGFANYVSDRPLNTPADFKGMTVRATENPVQVAWLTALGANPVTIPYSEAFTAIQNGTVDAVNMPIPTMYAGLYHTAADYFNEVDLFSTSGLLTFSQVTYDRLTPEQQKIIDESGKEAIHIGRSKMQELTAAALAGMENEGATMIKPDMAAWVPEIEEICWNAVVKTGLVSMEEIQKIRSIVTQK